MRDYGHDERYFLDRKCLHKSYIETKHKRAGTYENEKQESASPTTERTLLGTGCRAKQRVGQGRGGIEKS
eukprot:CAMPEP_0174364778 /NCGR_PEP_ID=MMETSP0811_2-20130205/74392_1 /TAXON_ID=73025 ORGANISM="Eutreptiella gymnastica-like, Strain CCMP1594" /NCGR_SAMPLE_ID=MMETSP0811_2 /ASSEMBLY_ACC=CAM_ASM_000667 /LENGTH=69 /DNA_ID=CAMNT_0015504785 /DNA_START=42 /DNA_END=251 /DNA_ORIENTATION=-